MMNDILIYLGYEVERRKAAYFQTAKRYGAVDPDSCKSLGRLLEAQRIKQAIEIIIAQNEKGDAHDSTL